MHSFIGPILQHNLLEKCEVDIHTHCFFYIPCRRHIAGCIRSICNICCTCATYMFVIVSYTSTHPCSHRSPKKPKILVDLVLTSFIVVCTPMSFILVCTCTVYIALPSLLCLLYHAHHLYTNVIAPPVCIHMS